MANAPKLTIDFSNVSDGGASRVPAGDYVFKIAKIEQRTSQREGGGAYLNWQLKGVTGEAKGAVIYHVTSLKPQALFNLYNLLVATGMDIPQKKTLIDFNKLLGKHVGATVDDDEYTDRNGKKRKKTAVLEFWPVKKTPDGKWVREDNDVEEEDEDEVVVVPEEELIGDNEDALWEKEKEEEDRNEDEDEDGDEELDEELTEEELEDDLEDLEAELE